MQLWGPGKQLKRYIGQLMSALYLGSLLIGHSKNIQNPKKDFIRFGDSTKSRYFI